MWFHYRELLQAKFIFDDADVTIGGADVVGMERVLKGDLDDRQGLEGNTRLSRRRRR